MKTHTRKQMSLTVVARLPPFKRDKPQGVPIGIVSSKGPSDGSIILVHDTVVPGGTSSVKLRNDELTCITPTRAPNGRDLIFIAGPSGSGKSTTVKLFCAQYRAMWPDRPIVLLSKLCENDPSLSSDLLGIKRINVQTLVDRKMELSELDHALLIADDVEGLPTGAGSQAEAVQTLVDLIANQGRHSATTLLYCSHLLCAHRRTANLLHECQTYVLFPNGTSASQLRRCLEQYAGLSLKTIKAIKKMPSRWVAVRKLYPPTILWEGGATLASLLD